MKWVKVRLDRNGDYYDAGEKARLCCGAVDMAFEAGQGYDTCHLTIASEPFEGSRPLRIVNLDGEVPRWHMGIDFHTAPVFVDWETDEEVFNTVSVFPSNDRIGGVEWNLFVSLTPGPVPIED